MSSWLRHRAPTGTMLCWLLVVSLTAVSAAMPILAGGVGPDSVVAHHAVAGDIPALPSPAGDSPQAAVDDLSGTAATAVFRLSSPAARHLASPAPPAPQLQTRAHPRALERGPPPPVR